MSSQGRRTIITRTQQSPLPTCNPNLMPFHIGYTGPAAVSMYLRVEKMKTEEELKEEKEAVLVMKDSEENKVEEVTMREGENTKEVVDEVKVAVNDSTTKDENHDSKTTSMVEEEDVKMKEGENVKEVVDEVKAAVNDSTTKDENHDSNTTSNVEDGDVKMKPDLLAPAGPIQDSQLTDVEMTSALPTLPLSSSSLSTIPSSSYSNVTLSGSIQSLASTSTLVVSSESLNSSILTTPSATTSSSSGFLAQLSSSGLKDVDKRFISSFRGRTIHGLTVDIPIGYTGLLLQGDPEPTADHVICVEGEDAVGRKTRSKGKGIDGKAKGKAKGKEKEHTQKAPPKGRLARTAAPRVGAEPEVITVVDNEDQEMKDTAPSNTTEPAAEVTNEDLEPEPEIPIRKLIPQSTFSSITLWHADRAVDETRDEYYRTLTEWMTLSHEIHRTDL